ncbi:hypothetical protein [Lysobacter gummosus]
MIGPRWFSRSSSTAIREVCCRRGFSPDAFRFDRLDLHRLRS